MVVRVDYNLNEDKPAGVEAVYKGFNRFMFANNWELAPTGAGQQDIRDAIDEIWDAITAGISAQVHGSVTGALTVADEEELLVIASLVVGEKFRHYLTQLPGATGGGP
jgi:ABC-type branched-subunit amino acid transport system permease subunit